MEDIIEHAEPQTPRSDQLSSKSSKSKKSASVRSNVAEATKNRPKSKHVRLS